MANQQQHDVEIITSNKKVTGIQLRYLTIKQLNEIYQIPYINIYIYIYIERERERERVYIKKRQPGSTANMKRETKTY